VASDRSSPAGVEAIPADAVQGLIVRALDAPGYFEALFERLKAPSVGPFQPEVRARGMNWLGHTLTQKERFEQTALCFSEALRAPDDPARTAERHSNLGMALGQLGRFAEEREGYERALALSPTPLIHLNCALSLLRMGDFEAG